MTTISEADVEEIALKHLADHGWQTTYGPDLERDYSEVIFADRLWDSLTTSIQTCPTTPSTASSASSLNPKAPASQPVTAHSTGCWSGVLR